jgi:hypothetical protein
MMFTLITLHSNHQGTTPRELEYSLASRLQSFRSDTQKGKFDSTANYAAAAATACFLPSTRKLNYFTCRFKSQLLEEQRVTGMSLKQDQINRSSVGRFLAALLRPFKIMESEPPSGLTYLPFHGPHGYRSLSMREWCSEMADSPKIWDSDRDNHYMKCSLRRIEHYKCTPSPNASCCMQKFQRNGLMEREFLVFYFSHWIDGCSAEAAVSVDRDLCDIYHQDTSSKQSSELIDPPSSETHAYDTAYMFGSPRDLARYLVLAYGPYKKLRTLPFSSASPPSALEVSTLLSVVHRQASAYDVYEHESHWFADTVWRSLIKLFSGDEELCRNHSAHSRYRGTTSEQLDQSVKAVCDTYQPEWQRMLETFEQVEQRHQAERAKVGCSRPI